MIRYKIKFYYDDVEYVDKRDSTILDFKPTYEQLQDIKKIVNADNIEMEELHD